MLQSGVRYFELKVRFHYPRLIMQTEITEAWLRLPADDKATQRRKVSKRSDAILPPATEEMSGEEGTTEKQDQEQQDRARRETRRALPLVKDKRLFLYHNGAYSHPLSQALKEIDIWLGTHRNEVVVLRVSNTDDRHDISGQLARELSVISHTGVNENRNPRLGAAVNHNKRIVLFLKQKHFIYRHDIRVHPIVKLDTTIKLHKNCVETTTLYAKRHRERENHHTIQIDWFHTLGGVCNKELAQLCNSREIDRLELINQILLRDYHHPLNVILMDYVESGDGDKLNQVVQKINKKNVLLYA